MSLVALLSLAISILPTTHHCDRTNFGQLVPKAQLVLVAEVVEVQPSPGYWSGTAPSVQRVLYKVKRVLKGSFTDKQILVGHYVVKNSLSADNSYPQLSQGLFTKGNELLLFLKIERTEYFSISENCGATSANAKTIKVIEGVISARQKKQRRNH